MTLTDGDASFGTLVKTFRRRRRHTQQHLADTLGIHRSTLFRWERGDCLPESKAQVLELARCLTLNDQEARQLLETSFTALSPYWSVPLPRNPYFTGREEILEALHTQLGVDHTVALTKSSALHGLGGVGKTQIALEYAYRHALEYCAVFWLGAETEQHIISSLVRVAEVLQLPERREKDQFQAVTAVQRWLTTHGQWLLIWDNLEDLTLLDRFLPTVHQGAALITTRCHALGTRAQGLELLPMESEEGIRCLLRRAKALALDTPQECWHHLVASQSDDYRTAAALVRVLGGLPLALDQAGAYIEETGCGVAGYLARYEKQRAPFLNRRGGLAPEHPHSVTTTFTLLLQRAEREQPAAAEILRMCCLLYAEAIPEELLVEGAAHLGPELVLVATDPARFDQAIATLRSLSLVQRQPQSHTLSLHRLVQAVVQDQMSEQERIVRLRQLSAALAALFPEETSDPSAWGQCERLLPHVLRVAATLSEQAGSSELVQLLCRAGEYLRERGQYTQAEWQYRQALRMGEQLWGETHPDLAQVLDRLAFLSGEQGHYEHAEELGRRALHLRGQALGATHPLVADSLVTLAILFTEQGKYEQAEPLFQRAIYLYEQSPRADHHQIATALNRLGFLYWRQGKYTQAELLLQRALATWTQAFGPDSLRMVPTLINLALLSWKQGQYAQAEHIFQRAIHRWEQVYGPVYAPLAHALTGLAIVCAEQGKYAQAEPLLQRARAIWEKMFGPDHHQVAVALSNLGELAGEQGNYESAEWFLQRALRIEERVWGPEHPQVAFSLQNLAELSTKQGKDAQAELLFQRVLRIWERAVGPEHPDMARPLHGLATLALKAGKSEQAEALYQRALRLREVHLGETHPDTAQTLYELAFLWHHQGERDKALSFATRALTIHAHTLGEGHPQTAATRALHAQLVQEQEHCPGEEAASADVKISTLPSRQEHHPTMRVAVRGGSKQVVYTRTVNMRAVTFTCTICGQTVSQLHYPSGRLKYCSETCRAMGATQRYEAYVARQREKRKIAREAQITAATRRKGVTEPAGSVTPLLNSPHGDGQPN